MSSAFHTNPAIRRYNKADFCHTTCIAISFGMPSMLHASGISSNEHLPRRKEAPLATQRGHHAQQQRCRQITGTPNVWTAANVRTVMASAAPAMMVAPSGIWKRSKYIPVFGNLIFSHSATFTGILAAAGAAGKGIKHRFHAGKANTSG